MPTPTDVAAFHADYDQHTDDRVRFFEAIAAHLPAISSVLYPGSYVDIAPSVWFDDVVYVDIDKRAPRFFGEREAVIDLIASKRRTFNSSAPAAPRCTFHHLDYREELPVPEGSVDVLISLYAGFISEHCTQHLRVGGWLLVNASHGDAAMAAIDDRYELSAVITSRDGRCTVRTANLGEYMMPKKPQAITIDSLHESGRGVAYTKPAFAYLFERVA